MLVFWDWITGTDQQYRIWKANQQQKMKQWTSFLIISVCMNRTVFRSRWTVEVVLFDIWLPSLFWDRFVLRGAVLTTRDNSTPFCWEVEGNTQLVKVIIYVIWPLKLPFLCIRLTLTCKTSLQYFMYSLQRTL
jgi:hypothetical protein